MSALTSKMQKIAYYLGQGLKPAQVASICNVTPGYISQLLGADGPQAFKLAVAEEQEKAAAAFDEDKDLELRSMALEAKTLKCIEDGLAGATLAEQVKVLEALNKRDLIRKQLKGAAPLGGAMPMPGQTINYNILSLQMPAHMANSLKAPMISLNSMNQVLEIEGRSMAPMSSQQVKSLFQRAASDTIEPSKQKEAPAALTKVPDDF
jgi:acetylglutamate kinase